MRVHVVVPEGFDDPGRPSGGNVYDRRVCTGLADAGWDVRIVPIAGAWAEGGAGAGLVESMAAIPDGATVLIDGLIASPAAADLLPHARRLRLVVLLHMPLATAQAGGDEPAAQRSERAVLGAATAVVVTSEWTRRHVLKRFPISAERVHVARPGTDPVDAASLRTPTPRVGGQLLCVGVLAPHKGQDVLVEALAGLPELDWDCMLVGPLDRDRQFVDRLRARIQDLDLAPRIRIAGVLTGAALDRAYAAADLLVVPSRSETFGMVVTEAIAHGLPVLAAAVGGLPEALGLAADGSRPGTLITPDDPAALATELGRWLGDESHRRRLRSSASQRRSALPGWEDTVRELADALTDSVWS